MKNKFVLPLFAAALLLPVACHKSATAPAVDTTVASAAEPAPMLHGVIVELRPGDSALVIRHDDIPGVMPAMTMPFKVDPPVFATAKKGHSVTAIVVQRDNEFWLRDVKLTP